MIVDISFSIIPDKSVTRKIWANLGILNIILYEVIYTRTSVGFKRRLVTEEAFHHTGANIKTLPDSGFLSETTFLGGSRDLLGPSLICVIYLFLIQEHFPN